MLRRTMYLLVVSSSLGCVAPRAPQHPTRTAALLMTPEQQIEEAAGKGLHPDMIRICEYDYVTGTHIPEWSCRSLNDRERERVTAQSFLMHAGGKDHRFPSSLGGN